MSSRKLQLLFRAAARQGETLKGLAYLQGNNNPTRSCELSLKGLAFTVQAFTSFKNPNPNPNPELVLRILYL
jgi:hypothetical protein